MLMVWEMTGKHSTYYFSYHFKMLSGYFLSSSMGITEQTMPAFLVFRSRLTFISIKSCVDMAQLFVLKISVLVGARLGLHFLDRIVGMARRKDSETYCAEFCVKICLLNSFTAPRTSTKPVIRSHKIILHLITISTQTFDYLSFHARS
jgi:hypothetical protein